MIKINRKEALPQRYMEEIKASEPLSPEAESALARRIRQGDMVARAELIEANLKFVVSVALKYQNKGMPLEDLISAGNIGLIRALEGKIGKSVIVPPEPLLTGALGAALLGRERAEKGRKEGSLPKRERRLGEVTFFT